MANKKGKKSSPKKKTEAFKVGSFVWELYLYSTGKGRKQYTPITEEDFSRSSASFRKENQQIFVQLAVVTAIKSTQKCQVKGVNAKSRPVEVKYLKPFGFKPTEDIVAAIRKSGSDFNEAAFMEYSRKAQYYEDHRAAMTFKPLEFLERNDVDFGDDVVIVKEVSADTSGELFQTTTPSSTVSASRTSKKKKTAAAANKTNKRKRSQSDLAEDFVTPKKRSTRSSVASSDSKFDVSDDLTLSSKEKKYLKAVDPGRDSPTLKAITRELADASDIHEDSSREVSHTSESLSGANESKAENIKKLENARYPIIGVDFLKWLDTDEAKNYLRKILKEETYCERHQEVMTERAVHGRFSQEFLLDGKITFLDDNEMNGIVDHEILLKIIENVLMVHGKPKSVEHLLDKNWLRTNFATKYANYVLRPEGLIYFITIQYGVSMEKATEEYYRNRITAKELEEFDNFFKPSEVEDDYDDPPSSPPRKKKKGETLAQLMAREGYEHWCTLPDLETTDEEDNQDDDESPQAVSPPNRSRLPMTTHV